MARKTDAKKSSTQPPPSPDVVWAARNWYLSRYVQDQKRRRATSTERIGISQATKKLVDDLLTEGVPHKPPEVGGSSSLETALYPYTRDLQLANQGIGYGENYVDVLWKRKHPTKEDPTDLERVERLSRRTISGRQPEDAQENERPAASQPEPDEDRTRRSTDIREIGGTKPAEQLDTKTAKVATVSQGNKQKRTTEK